jgi:hypothetical protein
MRSDFLRLSPFLHCLFDIFCSAISQLRNNDIRLFLPQCDSMFDCYTTVKTLGSYCCTTIGRNTQKGRAHNMFFADATAKRTLQISYRTRRVHLFSAILTRPFFFCSSSVLRNLSVKHCTENTRIVSRKRLIFADSFTRVCKGDCAHTLTLSAQFM